MIEVRCPGCGKTNRAPDKLLGKRGRCPSCGTVFFIGEPGNVLSDEALKEEIHRLSSVEADAEAADVSAEDLTERDENASAPPSASPTPKWIKLGAVGIGVMAIVAVVAFGVLGVGSQSREEAAGQVTAAVAKARTSIRAGKRDEAVRNCRIALSNIHRYHDEHKELRFSAELKELSGALADIESYRRLYAQYQNAYRKGRNALDDKQAAEAKKLFTEALAQATKLQQEHPDDEAAKKAVEEAKSALAEAKGTKPVQVAKKPPESTKPKAEPTKPKPKPAPPAQKPQPKPTPAPKPPEKKEEAQPAQQTASKAGGLLIIDDFKGALRWTPEPAWSNPPGLKKVEEGGKPAMTISHQEGKKDKWVASLQLNANLKPYRYVVIHGVSKGKAACNVALGIWPNPGYALYESRPEYIRAGKPFKLVFDLQSQTFKSEKTKWKNNGAVEGLEAVAKLSLMFYSKADFGDIVITLVAASSEPSIDESSVEKAKTAAPAPKQEGPPPKRPPGRPQDGRKRPNQKRVLRRRPAGK